MKYFIITVDTEGDNLWQYRKGENVTTENSLYVPRFQELCERFGFKPVWLTNYEMASDERFVNYIKPKEDSGLCEVGIHIHAWNNPPIVNLNGNYPGNAYLIEYPTKIMYEKFETCYNLIAEKFGHAPISHRAGRWIMNDEYFSLLEQFNIKVDCSVTPLVDWGKTPGETIGGGCNYSGHPSHCYMKGNVLEVPMSIRRIRITNIGSWKHKLKTFIFGKTVWLRPAMFQLADMEQLVKDAAKSDDSYYLEFMVHSSELMPGGSPYFESKQAVDELYLTLEKLFNYVMAKGYSGITLKDFSSLFLKNNEIR